MSHKTVTILLCVIAVVAFGCFLFLAWSIATKNDFYTSLLDYDTGVYLHTRATSTLESGKFFLFFTHLADMEIMVISLIVLSLILVLIHERIIAAFFISGLAFGGGLSLVFKSLLLRPRPFEVLFSIPHRGYAFPSGHALISLVFYGFLGYALVHSVTKLWQKIVITIVTVLLVFLIGISRVYLGVHWTTDVLGGWLLGGVLLIALILTFRAIHKKISHEYRPLRKTGLVISVLCIAIFSFSLFYYYVTQAAELRSIRDSITNTTT